MTSTPGEPSSRLAAAAKRVLDERWQAYPNEAASAGLHAYDGLLPAVTEHTIAARTAQLRASLAEVEAVPVEARPEQGRRGLADRERFDRELLIAGLGNELFELSDWQAYRRNPMALMGPIEVTNYLDRSYAPVEQRLGSLAEVLRRVPDYLESVKALLEPPFAAPVLQQSIESYDGIAGFYRGDLAAFVERNAAGALAWEVSEAGEAAARAGSAFADYLRPHQSTANDDFAIGADRFSTMLRLGEMVELPLADIEAAGERELSRHQETVRLAASRIAPGAPISDAIASVVRDHPAAEKLIDETRDMLEEIRAYVVDNRIASVVSEVRAEVRETPAFMRWAFAAMDGPGPFEEVATESFYYVTPVEGHWSAEQAEEWLSNFNYATLKIISVHEVYPGHYVHFLRHHNAPTPVSKVFGAYSFWEGWAHYCEEMMLEAGYGGGDPRLQFAAAQEALVRVCRLLSSIRMHTQGMPLTEAGRFFQENAYMEELPAQREALRGTFDPGYLNYTLGKLLIYKLRADGRAEQGAAYSLGAFHDELLGHGGPPVPLLRRFMLRDDDGRVLAG